MNVSPDALRKEVVALLRQIDDQIAEIRREAYSQKIRPTDLRDNNGSWVMSPLLLAKAQAYSTLVALNEPRR